MYVGQSFPPGLYVILLNFFTGSIQLILPILPQHQISKLPEVSEFQHHTKPCSKCNFAVVSSLTLSPICWRKDSSSCWMLLLSRKPWIFFLFRFSVASKITQTYFGTPVCNTWHISITLSVGHWTVVWPFNRYFCFRILMDPSFRKLPHKPSVFTHSAISFIWLFVSICISSGKFTDMSS